MQSWRQDHSSMCGTMPKLKRAVSRVGPPQQLTACVEMTHAGSRAISDMCGVPSKLLNRPAHHGVASLACKTNRAVGMSLMPECALLLLL